ncbi:MAG TPA: MFS transporter [Candidatus Limnocylindrales bacterium]
MTDLRGPVFGLSRQLWLVQVGIFVNMLGYGAVLPFEIIYLHEERGFGLGVAGLVVGAITGVAVVTAPMAGPLIDRFGARAAVVCGSVALAAGYAGLALAVEPWAALAAAAVAGAGNGVLNPGQSALVAGLASRDIRHRATAVSRVAANAGFGLGGAVGGLVAALGLAGFVALFFANTITYLVFAGVLLAVVPAGARAEPVARGYRVVLRDRAFMHLVGINLAMIAVGWSVFSWLLPTYAGGGLHIGVWLVGVLLTANAVTVVLVQVPVARLAEGRRRTVMIKMAAAVFAGACLIVVAAGLNLFGPFTFAALVVAAIAVGVGECLHTSVLMPLVADLAPVELRGRYMAAMGLSWWVGLAAGPTLGTPLLGRAPLLAFAAAAALAALAGVAASTLERRLPPEARLTPRPTTGSRLATVRDEGVAADA